MSVHLAAKNYARGNHVRDDVVRARINSNLKKDVEKVFHRLGLTMSEAISLYLAQVKLANGIPFDVRIPNKTTLKIFRDTDKKKNLYKAKSVKEILAKAGV